MAADGILKALTIATTAETKWATEHLEAVSEDLAEARRVQSRSLKNVAREGSIADMLKAEKVLLTEELRVARDPLQRASIEEALTQLESAMGTLDMLMHRPEDYKALNEGMSYKKNRIGPYPRDQVREFFKSERARLQNLSKGRLSDDERGILSDRRHVLKTAEAQYIKKQQEFLESIGQAVSKSNGKGR